jgi:hypothetical protein
MKKQKELIAMAAVITVITVISCNNGLTGEYGKSGASKKPDRSQRTTIDASEYVDFTIPKYNALMFRKEDILFTLGEKNFRNGNSYIKINRTEGTIEINSDSGEYKGKKNCQIYGKYGFEIMAASPDCLYIRHNKSLKGTLLIDGEEYRNEQIPDLPVCLPLYGFSKNRIEISPVMNGYIVMPSGTYWNR